MSPSIDITVLVAFLRLGDKYEIKFSNAAKARLALHYPSSVPAFALAKISTKCFTGVDPYHFRAINLAREVRLFWALPAAIYMCLLECPLETLVNGYNHVGDHCSPSPVNQSTCLSAYNSLALLRQQSFQWLGTPQFEAVQKSGQGSDCFNRGNCTLNAHTVLT